MDLVREVLQADGHLIALMTGGMSTEAVTACTLVYHTCYGAVQTSINYLQTFTSIPPESELVARLGWAEYVAGRPLLLQMSSIRAADAKLPESVRRSAGVAGAKGRGSPSQD